MTYNNIFHQGRLISEGPYSEIKDMGLASLLGSMVHDSEKTDEKKDENEVSNHKSPLTRDSPSRMSIIVSQLTLFVLFKFSKSNLQFDWFCRVQFLAMTLKDQ